MGTPLKVLIVEDSVDDSALLARELQRGDYDPVCERVETADGMRDVLRQKWDIIISDYTLPKFGALQALTILQEKNLDIPFIVVSGSVSETTVLAALKAGANDYLMKDNLTRLAAAVERELREATGRRERRRLEAQLLQAQKMEAVGRLASGVAHDFNNLLTIITGYSELLQSTEGLSESQGTALEEIRKASERGSSLTHQLLAFSRRQPLAPRIVDLNHLVLNMEKMLGRLIGEDIDLITIPEPDLGLVKADPGQLEHVIMNLVVNARDAMPNGGKLTIETRNIEGDDSPFAEQPDLKPGSYVMLAITDSGIGMDAETRAHLFEPFFTTKSPGQGTGLGLATAYGVIKQSGGNISVYSEPGQGTSMKVYLPRTDEAAACEQPDLEPDAALRGTETILLVEDEARVRKLICDILCANGYRVLEATAGDQAIQISESHRRPIHLALVDVVMPELSGPDMVKQIAALHPETRVLYISGYTDEAMVRHGVLASGDAFLPKPFLPTALVRKVREVLDARNATASPNH